MRQFTQEELAIAGAEEVAKLVLTAIHFAVKYKTSPNKTKVGAQACQLIAINTMVEAHDKLMELDVNVMLIPAPRGKRHNLRRIRAQRYMNDVLALIRSDELAELAKKKTREPRKP